MKQEIIELISTYDLFEGADVAQLLERPKLEQHGDWSLPLFIVAKQRKQSPVELAQELVKLLEKEELFEKVEACGPYVNMYIDKKQLCSYIYKKIKNITKEIHTKDPKHILIEYPSPNTNKQLHIGHVRNMAYGSSVVALLKAIGHKVSVVNLNNDRGIAICKSMVGYLRYGNGEEPVEAPDEFVGKYYVLFEEHAEEDKSLQEEAQKLLQKWEAGDKEVRELWKKMNGWAYEGFQEMYDVFGLKFDKQYYESELYTEGKSVVQKGLDKSLFSHRDDGAVVVDLEQEGYGEKVLLRSDGTSIYITQDLALAYQKRDDFNADAYCFVVADEQSYHFNVLFTLLEKLGFGESERFKHLSYGLVTLREGKMSSRKGNAVGAREIFTTLTKNALEELKKRQKGTSNDQEYTRRARVIAKAALIFFMLKNTPAQTICFKPEESLSFEGETGTYLLYTYARICSLLKRGSITDTRAYNVGENEYSLLRHLELCNEIIEESAIKHKPSTLAMYLLHVAQKYNEYYQKETILDDDQQKRDMKLLLTQQVQCVLKYGLTLLGIEVLEEM